MTSFFLWQIFQSSLYKTELLNNKREKKLVREYSKERFEKTAFM